MMTRRHFLAAAGCTALASCAPPPSLPELGTDGQPLPVLYRIDPADTGRIRFRVRDSVNALRAAAGAAPLALDPALNAAAATHARDMAMQNRRRHFGSDGSSPTDRAERAGYAGTVLGETIAETYEAELNTVTAWMMRPDTRDVIVDPRGRDLGIAFHQEETGKIWWTLLVGDGGMTGPADAPGRQA